MKPYNMGDTWEAIVLWKKKGPLYSQWAFFTREGIVLNGHLENKKLNTLKDSGYLQAFSRVQITMTKDKDFKRILQVDGQSVLLEGQSSLKNITYLAFLGELIYKFFSQGEAHRELYRSLEGFCRQAKKKPLPLAVLIMAWQALAISGFLPNASYLKQSKETELLALREVMRHELEETIGGPLSTVFMENLGQMIAYNWDSEDRLRFSQSQWVALEKALYSFSQYHLGEPISAATFLHTMGIHLFSKE